MMPSRPRLPINTALTALRTSEKLVIGASVMLHWKSELNCSIVTTATTEGDEGHWHLSMDSDEARSVVITTANECMTNTVISMPITEKVINSSTQ